MALFSRRPKQTDPADAQTPAPEATPPAEVGPAATDGRGAAASAGTGVTVCAVTVRKPFTSTRPDA